MKNNNYLKLVTSLSFILIFIAVLMLTPEKAAAKPVSINAHANGNETLEIGIQQKGGIKIWVKGRHKKARYTFTAVNKGIVEIKTKVSKSGVPYAYIYGLKEGTTKIKVKETYKGKTRTIGTHQFIVKPAKIAYSPVNFPLSPVYYNGGDIKIDDSIIKYRNSKATYEFTTKDSDILTLKPDGTITATLKEGTADVKVTEVYKGKRKSAGDVKVNIEKLSIVSDNIDLIFEESTNLDKNINFSDAHELVDYTILDENGVPDTEYLQLESNEKPIYKGKKLGKVTVEVNLKGSGEKVGVFTITIQEFVPPEVEDFTITYIDNIDNGLKTLKGNKLSGKAGEVYTFILNTAPIDAAYYVKGQFKNNNSEIAEAKDTTTEEFITFEVVLKKPGTAEIEITCGSVKKIMYVTVTE